MSVVTPVLRKTGPVLVLLLALFIVLMAASRLTTPTPGQRAALALMEADELPDGRNAFGLLWTLERDVPLGEIATVPAADAAHVAEWQAQPITLTPDGRGLRLGLRDDARAAWAELVLPPALWSPPPGGDSARPDDQSPNSRTRS